MIVRLAALFSALILGWIGPTAAGLDGSRAAELRIGITQFPSTLNPMIDSMLAKSYVLAMTRRPVTVYDQNWELVCMLCTELPTIENGMAVPEDLPDGKQGIAVTYKIRPEATWGDGEPVTSADVVFTWEVGRHPKTGVSNFEAFRRILSVEVVDDKTFHAPRRPYHLRFCRVPNRYFFRRTSSGRFSRPARKPTATAPPSTPTRPTRALPSGPTGWRRLSPAPTSYWGEMAPGGAPSRPSTGSPCG